MLLYQKRPKISSCYFWSRGTCGIKVTIVLGSLWPDNNLFMTLMRCLIPNLQCTVKSTPLKLFIFLYFKISHKANATYPEYWWNTQSLFSNFDKPWLVGTSSLNVESSPETHSSAGNDPERAWLSPQPLPLPLPFSWAISRRGFEADCQISVLLERINTTVL